MMMEEGVGEIVKLESTYAVRSALVRRLEAEAALASLRAQREQERWDKEHAPLWHRPAAVLGVVALLLVRFV